MSNELTVVILAAGLGTRMKSRQAKVLHHAGGDTLLNQVIRAATAVAGSGQIVAVIGHQAERVRASVRLPGVRFAIQEHQRGTGDAVRCAAQEASRTGDLLILNGDGPLLRGETLRTLVDLHRSQRRGGAIVTMRLEDPTGYGRIIRDAEGTVSEIVEQKSATPEQGAIKEVNPGLYCFDAAAFWGHVDELKDDNAAREFYLTDMVGILRSHGHRVTPLPVADETELLGINTRVELAAADRILRARKAQELMLAGVTLENPGSVTADLDVEVGPDTVVEANVQLRGRTRIGTDCKIGTGTVLRDCEVGDKVTILPYVVADNCAIADRAFVGPFSRLRMHAVAAEDTHIGNFVELKNTTLGAGAKANHLAYLGDAAIGAKSNIGAGTITCNYDGKKKHRTEIGDAAFIGSNSTLVAPLEIGAGSYIAAGSVITKNVDAEALAIGRAHQVEKAGWAKKRLEQTNESS